MCLFVEKTTCCTESSPHVSHHQHPRAWHQYCASGQRHHPQVCITGSHRYAASTFLHFIHIIISRFSPQRCLVNSKYHVLPVYLCIGGKVYLKSLNLDPSVFGFLPSSVCLPEQVRQGGTPFRPAAYSAASRSLWARPGLLGATTVRSGLCGLRPQPSHGLLLP